MKKSHIFRASTAKNDKFRDVFNKFRCVLMRVRVFYRVAAYDVIIFKFQAGANADAHAHIYLLLRAASTKPMKLSACNTNPTAKNQIYHVSAPAHEYSKCAGDTIDEKYFIAYLSILWCLILPQSLFKFLTSTIGGRDDVSHAWQFILYLF